MAPGRVFILDGHNIIFALGGLQALQTSGRGAEARSRLVERLQAFAHRQGERVLVVFDGNELATNPDALRTPLFEIVYTRRGHQVADDRILSEARRRAEAGETVTVVTNDRNTLGNLLPRGVRRVGVREFWTTHIEPRPREEEKRVEGDFTDLEQAMLALAPEERPGQAVRRPGSGSPASPAPAPGRPASAEVLRREELRRKRERGRLRQQRLLKRRRPPG
jgi:predicted RNA-binding protein with PIN domain